MTPRITAGPASKNEHGQYFTPKNVASLMVSMLKSPRSALMLEPSAGEGVFLSAALQAGFTNIQGVEIDKRLIPAPQVPVAFESFVSWKAQNKYNVVIGNPPYIRWKNLGQEQKDELQESPYWGTLLNTMSDYLVAFIVKSIDLLDKGGELVFVTPDFWMYTQHSAPLRAFMLENGAVTDLVRFGESTVFKGVSSSIVIFRFVKSSRAKTVRLLSYIGPRTLGSDSLKLTDRELFQLSRVPAFNSKQPWTLVSAEKLTKLDALEKWAKRPGTTEYVTLGSLCEIANGMVTGLDKAFRLSDEFYSKLSNNEKSATISVSKALGLSELYSDSTVHYCYLPDGLTETEAQTRYPVLMGYLDANKEELLKRYAMKGILPYWEWAFKRSESKHLDKRQKIFVPSKERMTNRKKPRFALVPINAIATQDVTALAVREGMSESIEYIVAYLLLDEVVDWITTRGLMKGGVAEFSERPLASIPIRTINWRDKNETKAHDAIVRMVQQARSGSISRDTFAKNVRKYFNHLGLDRLD